MLKELIYEINSVKFIPYILDDINDGIVIISKDSTVVYANEAYSRILGISKKKVLGKKVNIIEPNAIALEVLNTKKTIVNKYDKVESLKKQIIVSAYPIIVNDKFLGVICIFSDITEILNLSSEIERLNKNELLLKKHLTSLQEKLNSKKSLPNSFTKIIGQSSNLIKQLELAFQVSPTDAPILIQGESGVGKELVAKAIHLSSERKEQPFIAVNCAAIPESLVESELFGYEPGSFTGADSRGKKGYFELANNGTLFLDEVGDMNYDIQAKILRALQESEINRIGSQKPIKTNVRIISATHQDLQKLIEKKEFRSDLFYRLNVIPLNIPPLRERGDDIILLAKYFLKRVSAKEHKKLTFSDEVKEILLNYEWPGNVRELENSVKHCVFISDSLLIQKHHLPPYLFYNNHKKDKDSSMDLDPKKHNRHIDYLGNLKKEMDSKEKELIIRTLELTNNNRTKAMEILGVSRRTFYQKMKRHGIR